MVAVAALAEEIGRAALPSPLISTLAATCVLREARSDGARRWLERVAGGEPAALATTNADGSWEPGDAGVTAKPAAGGVVLDGTAAFVQDARKASFFVVSARGAGGIGLYAVRADAAGLALAPDHIVDLTRDQATLRFSGVRVAAEDVIAPPPDGERALERAAPALLTIVAADMCGAGEWELQTTVEYAKVRRQFDRPIGFFQGVKFPLVDVMVKLDEARSLVYAAACAIDTEPEEAERLARMAKASASDMATYASSRAVQLHGGIGFTWECDVHIYFKRQQHNALLYGDGSHQRARLAELIDRTHATTHEPSDGVTEIA
jgi:alkylation response protein AidB-like acyl-CoA dehydrogenase